MSTNKSIKSKIIEYLDHSLPEEELEELLRWINKSEDNTRYYSQIKDLWEASMSNMSEIAGTDAEWLKFEKEVTSRSSKQISAKIINWKWKLVGQVAAILILGVVIGSLLIPRSNNNEPVYCTAISPLGSISETILPDSTLIYLNAGSEIKYLVDANSKIREVFLTGEAWFKVSKDKKHPFVVHTPYYDVNVLGTEFNVKAYSENSKIETTLEQGIVKITGGAKLKLAKDIMLKPGEQLVFDKTQKSYQVKMVRTELYTSWKDSKLEFIKMSLKDLFILLERRYGVDIEVQDKEILSYHYSGIIKNETILELLEIIQHTMSIRYEIDGQTIKIFKK